MNQEILMLKGQLANYQTERQNLELQASGLISMLRIALNPYEEDLSRIKSAEVLQQAKQLHQTLERLREVNKKIEQLEGALNG